MLEPNGGAVLDAGAPKTVPLEANVLPVVADPPKMLPDVVDGALPKIDPEDCPNVLADVPKVFEVPKVLPDEPNTDWPKVLVV